ADRVCFGLKERQVGDARLLQGELEDAAAADERRLPSLLGRGVGPAVLPREWRAGTLGRNVHLGRGGGGGTDEPISEISGRSSPDGCQKNRGVPPTPKGPNHLTGRELDDSGGPPGLVRPRRTDWPSRVLHR